jgi:hypothetical protein
VLELTQQRREIKCPQRAYSCFPTPLSTEALYTGILVCLKDRFKACISNAFCEIFEVHNSSHRTEGLTYSVLSSKLKAISPDQV